MLVSANLLSSLIYRDSLSIPNTSQDLFPRNIDNVNSPINDRLLIPPSPNCHYHLFSIQLFDYYVNGHHLKNIATNGWPVLDGAFFNT